MVFCSLVAAAAQMDAPVTTPMVAAQEVMRAIGANIPIVDETFATSTYGRGFRNSDSARQYSYIRGGCLGWSMPAAVGCSLGLGREPVVCLVGDGAAMYSPQASGQPRTKSCPSPSSFLIIGNTMS